MTKTNNLPRSGITACKDTNIFHFLQAVPFLSISDKGLCNIAKRFGITPEELKRKIADFEKGGAE